MMHQEDRDVESALREEVQAVVYEIVIQCERQALAIPHADDKQVSVMSSIVIEDDCQLRSPDDARENHEQEIGQHNSELHSPNDSSESIDQTGGEEKPQLNLAMHPEASSQKTLHVTVENDDSEAADQRLYDRTFERRKRSLEIDAEERALKRMNQLDSEGKTLEQVIDVCLQEYRDFHEMAHTVRLKFEREKTKFLSYVQAMIANSQSARQSMLQAGPTPFGTQEEFQYFIEDEDQHPIPNEDTENIPPAQNVMNPAPRLSRGKPFAVPRKL